jgi:hypothetical protein
MDHPNREMSEERLAEIKARLSDRSPVTARSNADKSPVATYLDSLRGDQMELVQEVDRLRALIKNGRTVFE